MTFEVKIKKWHAVASWTWNAGKLWLPFLLASSVCALQLVCSVHLEPLLRAGSPSYEQSCQSLTQVPQATMCAASAECHLTAALRTASTLAMTALWSGASARTPFTCNASPGVAG
jgi:hypothetical protein